MFEQAQNYLEGLAGDADLDLETDLETDRSNDLLKKQKKVKRAPEINKNEGKRKERSVPPIPL